MQIETYEVEKLDQSEIQSLAADGEVALLIEQLGLKGQQELMAPGTREPIPYRRMTADEHVVYSALFPRRCAIADYKSGPIPLRVLQVAAHARTLELPDFAYLEVWFPRDGIDDPILVARKSSYLDPIYMLARWGDSLLPFSELAAKAEAVLIDRTKLLLISARGAIENILNDVPLFVKGKMSNGETPSPHFYE